MQLCNYLPCFYSCKMVPLGDTAKNDKCFGCKDHQKGQISNGAIYKINVTGSTLYMVGLSDSENFTITIVEIVIFTIMNTIMIVDLLNISIHNTKIKHRFLKY